MLTKIKISLLWILLLAAFSIQAQLHHMIGYVDMREAAIWVSSEKPSNLNLYLHRKGEKSKSLIISGATKAELGNTYIFHLDNLEPGVTYEYSFSLPGKKKSAGITGAEFTTQSLWQYRTDPPAFRMALGSCAYINETEFDRPGEPYGGDYNIFETIVAKDPDLMLWLGDNVYLREVDFGSKSGIIHRYHHCRNTPEIENLLHHCPNVAIWDDHDFGPNDANSSYVHKDWTLEAFKMFWANPSYGLPGTCKESGITTNFTFSDVEFFMLDNRYNRTSPDLKETVPPTILGEDQINWLIQALKQSKAPFKMIVMGGQFLNDFAYPENYSTYSEERDHIIKVISENKITGVFFLTGDRHCGEMSELKLPDGNVIYDLTVSPLTSKAYDITKENNTLRVEGTVTPERHFATLEFSGKLKEREMKISVFNSGGTLKWEKTIKAAR